MHFQIVYTNETDPSVHTELVVVRDALSADQWGHEHYKAHGVTGYKVFSEDGLSLINQWDEARNATWP